MTYRRLRSRNGLYTHEVLPSDPVQARLRLELDRMERDYLDPVYPEPPFAVRPEGSDPLTEVVHATGVDRESVRRVLYFVFKEQR